MEKHKTGPGVRQEKIRPAIGCKYLNLAASRLAAGGILYFLDLDQGSNAVFQAYLFCRNDNKTAIQKNFPGRSAYEMGQPG